MPFTAGKSQMLYYEDQGGSGPPVLFSHGFLMDLSMFAPQFQALAGRYRCIGWDQRGFGATGPAAAPFSYWDSAQDALNVLDTLGIGSAVLVGLSQGSFLSMRAALLAPARVRGLVLISSRPGVEAPDILDKYAALDREWIAHGSVNAAKPLADALIGAGTDHAPWMEKWAKMDKNALSWPIAALTGRDDVTQLLSTIRQPSLVINGDADPTVELAQGEALADSLPNRRGFIRIPGAGHAPTLTHPDQVNEALLTFLDGLDKDAVGA